MYPTKHDILIATADGIPAGQNFDLLVQEMVDRVYSEGWCPESREELTFTTAQLVEYEEGTWSIDLPTEDYVGAAGIRCDEIGRKFTIVDISALYNRPSVPASRIVDRGLVSVNGTEYRRYRLPNGLADTYDLQVLAERRAPVISEDSDEVPVPVASISKIAFQAIGFENAQDWTRAQVAWQQFRTEYFKASRREDGPKEVKIKCTEAWRSRPTNFP